MNLNSIFKAALEASWQGSLVVLLILLLRLIVGSRISAGWRSLFWTLALIRLLVPVFVLPPSPASLQNFAVAVRPVERAEFIFESAPKQTTQRLVRSEDAPVSVSLLSRAKMDWRKVSAQVWLGGACMLAVWLSCGAIRFQWRLARESSEVDASMARVWRKCCEGVSLRHLPRLLTTDAVASPALVGVLRPTLLLPRHAALSSEDCEHIFMHELAHYRRRDHWTNFLQLCVLCVHWFNPLVWLGFRALREDRELAADEWALNHLSGDRSLAYGETLLRLLAIHPAPAFPSIAIGIMENSAQIKRRLRRIVAFRPHRPARSFAGAVLLAGLGAIVLTAAESKVGSLAGWSVIRLSIPKDGEIKDAYVELKSPDGRMVTLTQGVTAKEGLTLVKVDWSGSPIQATVSLKKGNDQIELTADPRLVSKKNDLNRILPEIEIEAKFIEVPTAAAQKLKFFGSGALVGKSPGTPLPIPDANLSNLSGVFDEKEAERFLADLVGSKGVCPAGTPGVALLSAPRCTMRSGQRAVVEIIREVRSPSKWNPPDKANERWTPAAFETRNAGVMLNVEAKLVEGDSIDLELSPEVAEFVGMVDFETGAPLFTAQRDPDKPIADRMLGGAFEFKGRPYLPIFSRRKSKTSVSIRPGSTVVLSGFRESEDIRPFESPWAGRQLVVLIQASTVKPKASPAPQQNESAPPPQNPPPASNAPVATPVDGKPGFVTSPFAPKAGYIDVRGFPPETEVKCPYTGKIFQVP